MSKTLRETIDEAMHKMGFYDHPVTIGGSTSYVDENSPFAKNNQLFRQLPRFCAIICKLSERLVIKSEKGKKNFLAFFSEMLLIYN